MPRACTICTSDARQTIDMALLVHSASYRRIASRWGVIETSLRRHEKAHLRSSLAQAKELSAMLSAENMTEKLAEIYARADEQYEKADHADNVMAAVAVLRTSIATIDALARVSAIIELERRILALETGGRQ